MIGHIKRHYQKLQYRHKAILAVVFILGSITSLFSGLFANTILPFEDQLPTLFSSMDFNSGNFSNVHFQYGGNNYAGTIFWLSGETLSSPQVITLGPQVLSCSGQVKGIYYNNMRGWRIWPLDEESLGILSGAGGAGSGYATMYFTGGFYTNCTGLNALTLPINNAIYGEITHIRSGVTMHMVAGVDYDFTHNTIASGSAIWPSLVITGGGYSGWIRDNYGGVAEISGGQASGRCGNGVVDQGEECDGGSSCTLSCQSNLTGMCVGFTSSPSSPATITVGSGMDFTCNGTGVPGHAVTGYVLTIYSGLTSIYSGTIFTGVNSVSWTTGSSLTGGSYSATCTILADTGTGPICATGITINVNALAICTALSGDMTITGSYYATGGVYYVATSGVAIQIAGTQPLIYSITGNILYAPITGIYLNTTITGAVYLTQSNTGTTITHSYSTGSCTTHTGTARQVYLDTQAPTTPTIQTPIGGTGFCNSGNVGFSRTASTDSGAGLSGYLYSMRHSSGTGLSGFTTVTGGMISGQNMLTGNYSGYIQAIDNVGNISATGSIEFTVSPSYCTSTSTGLWFINAPEDITEANLNTLYSSDAFSIGGLTGSTLISIDLGMLVINGIDIGTTGMIVSGDSLKIELISSDEFEEAITSIMSIGSITGSFTVSTRDSSCNLSNDQENLIEETYALLKDQYDDDPDLLDDFLATFQDMIGDEVDITQDCGLDYLLDLINNDLDNTPVDTSNHIAPNCKEYQISYDNGERAYYSPMMRNRYYFVSRETLIRHIDFYNAGDCHINTYGNASWSNNRNTDSIHIAPSGKIYHIQLMNGVYTSTDFKGNKYFDAMSTITSYIDSKNPVTDVRDHTVDRTFIPILYLAPNNKEYRIYKTNIGYMSYKLMKVRYFQVLAELQDYINKNNRRK